MYLPIVLLSVCCCKYYSDLTEFMHCCHLLKYTGKFNVKPNKGRATFASLPFPQYKIAAHISSLKVDEIVSKTYHGQSHYFRAFIGIIIHTLNFPCSLLEIVKSTGVLMGP